ncbi:LOW QUALITY PROTEIN: hypothetical protein U9M48_017225 [Paspalum notatum var. saurae]|uniref:Reverse transcriptase Ty1/copia-type domain-containing protein n=1 Tax=Paspalum notatum var. saurae TaxID=547442 RepID=A0AAQ3T840_PASNO
MLTRGHAAALRARPELHVASSSPASTSASPIPANYCSALADTNWRAAMVDEYEALRANDTWRLVPRPSGANIVTGKWIFRHKFHADGSLACHKVVRGFSQQHDIDYDETFSPVVKQATIRVVLSIAVSRDWPIHQLDVKNAFLHGHLDKTMYCQEPPGFVDPSTLDHVCLLQKSLYGLKQAPRTWYQRFATYIRRLGFVPAVSDTSLFVYKEGTGTACLLLYVDDIVLTASSSTLLQIIMGRLHSEFAMTNLGALHHFLGISVTRSSDGLFLSQRQYALDLLQRAGMAECHSTATPVDTRAKLSATDGSPVADPSEYRSLAGALQYLTLTRPDLAYAVQQVCLFMHDPREPHLALIKRILRYVKGTLSTGLHLGKSSPQSLTAYSDVDWAGCPDSRRSTSRYCVFLGDNLISWSSKRQTTVSRSSAEAEYRAVVHAVAERCWLRQLLRELHVSIASANIVYCDNESVRDPKAPTVLKRIMRSPPLRLLMCILLKRKYAEAKELEVQAIKFAKNLRSKKYLFEEVGTINVQT